MEDREDVPPPHEARERGRPERRPRLRDDAAACRPRVEPLLECPRDARRRRATSRTRRGWRGSAAPARRIAARPSTVRRSKRERPEPSAMRTPASGTPRRRASRGRPALPLPIDPRRADGRAELLQQHLGGEVVALAVHVPERGSTSGSERSKAIVSDVRRCTTSSGASRSRRFRAARERPRRREQRRRRAVGADELHAGDGERGERPRLDTEVGRLPPGRVPARVEVRVVAEHAAGDPPDARWPRSRARAGRGRRGERRIAEADEPEVAAPDSSRP